MNEAAGQAHVFAFYDALSSEEQRKLASELEALNVERVNVVIVRRAARTCPRVVRV